MISSGLSQTYALIFGLELPLNPASLPPERTKHKFPQAHSFVFLLPSPPPLPFFFFFFKKRGLLGSEYYKALCGEGKPEYLRVSEVMQLGPEFPAGFIFSGSSPREPA